MAHHVVDRLVWSHLKHSMGGGGNLSTDGLQIPTRGQSKMTKTAAFIVLLLNSLLK